MNEIIAKIDSFNFADFFGDAPYAYLYTLQGSPFEKGQAQAYMAQRAKNVGYKNFTRTYSQFIDSVKPVRHNADYSGNYTAFSGQLLELACGSWNADDNGISRNDGKGGITACVHPIMPVERLEDIDTGITKIRLAFRLSVEQNWRYITVDMSTIATTRNITVLADQGIAVTSNNAAALVGYLHDAINTNFDIIPVKKCYSRLGFFPELGFAPYGDGLSYGGPPEYQRLLAAITAHGDYETWLEVARNARANIGVHIMLAASFAAPLLTIVGAQPFFLHLWSVISGNGKTVALMLAASVYANPDVYVHSHNTTTVGLERLSGFLNQLPICLDELQLAKDGKGGTRVDPYLSAQGTGKIRGTKNGGNSLPPTWRTVFLSTGESPLTDVRSGAGAVNRVISIEALPTWILFNDAPKVASSVLQNYGFAGKIFIETLYGSEDTIRLARELFDQNYAALCTAGATGKQARAGAVILTADQLAERWIFHDDNALACETMSSFLNKIDDTLIGRDAYEYICNWVSSNQNRFVHGEKEPPFDILGEFDDNYVWINAKHFRNTLADAGFNYRAVISWLKSAHLIDYRGTKSNTRSRRIAGGPPCDCIVLRLPDDQPGPSDEECRDEAPLPF